MILILQIVGGLLGLLLGGELLVRGASNVAVRIGLSPLVVGVVIVGFGTSAPELVTCVQAALAGAPGIAVGNIVGSNVANILLIVGAAALLRPFATTRAAVVRDGTIMIATAIAFALAAATGMLERWMGVVFVAALALYLVLTVRSDRRQEAPLVEDLPPAGGTVALPRASVMLLAGVALVVFGADCLVAGAVGTARLFDVSEEVIGLTLVAVGTSLPELATSVMAALKRHSQIALGNVLGSNIYNVLGIGGITALVQPVPVSRGMRLFDIPLMVAISVLLVVLVATGRHVSRAEGVFLLVLYGGYLMLQGVAAA